MLPSRVQACRCTPPPIMPAPPIMPDQIVPLETITLTRLDSMQFCFGADAGCQPVRVSVSDKTTHNFVNTTTPDCPIRRFTLQHVPSCIFYTRHSFSTALSYASISDRVRIAHDRLVPPQSALCCSHPRMIYFAG